jgi:hypothetical protein
MKRGPIARAVIKDIKSMIAHEAIGLSYSNTFIVYLPSEIQKAHYMNWGYGVIDFANMIIKEKKRNDHENRSRKNEETAQQLGGYHGAKEAQGNDK